MNDQYGEAYPAGSGPSGIAFDGTHIWVAIFKKKSVTKLPRCP